MFHPRILCTFLVLIMATISIQAQELMAPKSKKENDRVRSIKAFKSTGPDFTESIQLISFYNTAGHLTSFLENPQAARPDSVDGSVTLSYTDQGDVRQKTSDSESIQYIYAYDDPTTIPVNPGFIRKYFDDKGSLITKTTIDASGKLFVMAEHEYQYDEKGHVIQKKSFRAQNPQLVNNDSLSNLSWYETVFYVYDAKGNQIAQTIETAGYRKEIRTRYNEAELPVGTVESVLSGGWMTRYNYNNLKELILEERFRLDHQGNNSFLEYYKHYTYYSNYLLQSVRKVGPDGKETLIRYEYDFHAAKPNIPVNSEGGAG